MVNHYHNAVREHFHQLPNFPSLVCVNSFSHLWPQATTDLFLAFFSSFPDISRKQNHTICSLLCLAFFIQHNASEVHARLLLHSTPMQGYNTFWFRSPLDGHLDYLKFGAFMSGVDMNIYVPVFVGVYIYFFHWIPRSEIARL